MGSKIFIKFCIDKCNRLAYYYLINKSDDLDKGVYIYARLHMCRPLFYYSSDFTVSLLIKLLKNETIEGVLI